MSGVLRNGKAPAGRGVFGWSLESLAGGMARLQVDEAPQVGRYRINDILEAGAVQARSEWKQLSGDAKGSSFASGRMAVELTYQPFRIAVSIEGKPAVNLNSRDMFQFEHRRSKEVRGQEVAAAGRGTVWLLSLSKCRVIMYALMMECFYRVCHCIISARLANSRWGECQICRFQFEPCLLGAPQ